MREASSASTSIFCEISPGASVPLSMLQRIS